MAILIPPDNIANILRKLNTEGHDAYLVGGCVRDAIMGLHVNDWDVATSATPTEVDRIFPKTALTGERFGTVTVLMGEDAVEVTTFRAESEYKDGRHPDAVEFVSSLEEDLSRRDFTINAMAVSLAGELVDPFGGMEDVKRRIIRCVGEPDARFNEDALRMFRAFRFSAALGFTIGKDTLQAIFANAGMAKYISAERIGIELEKTLMSARPEITGDMIKAGLLNTGGRFPCIPAEHKGSVPLCSDGSLEGLENISSLPMEPCLRWCAFCAVLIDKGMIASAREFLRGIRLDGKTINTCARALSIDSFPDDKTGIKRLFALHGVDAVRCSAAAFDTLRTQWDGSLVFDGSTREPSPRVPCTLARTGEIIASGECFSLSTLAVTGGDLISQGHPPGPNLGATLNRLLDHVINYPEDNTRETLLKLAHNILL